MALGHDPTELVADADVLMNLMASGCAEEILSTLLLTLVVPPAVADERIASLVRKKAAWIVVRRRRVATREPEAETTRRLP